MNDYKFIQTDSAEIVADLTARYEEITGRTLLPSDPDKLFIQWLAGIFAHFYILINYAANQNIPSRAMGENLDALGETFYNVLRPQAKPAECLVRFELSAPQQSAVAIPQGTRVTDTAGSLTWTTAEEAAVGIGETFAVVKVVCESAGAVGNGYAPGQINKLIDADNVLYFSRCANVETSHSGSETATDAEYYELMRAGLEAFSTAGPKGAYEYRAKTVSTEIADVCAINPADRAGVVNIFAIMSDGSPADDGTKNAILAACNDDRVRPLTDKVEVLDPDVVDYNINLTYYVDRASNKPLNEVGAAVEVAVQAYVGWQSAKIGRDINPSKLLWYLKDAGAKRIDITSPVYAELRDGSGGLVPQIARLGTLSIIDGGYEDE